MLWSLIRSAIRNIIANKMKTLINVAGLTLGITGCIIVGLFVRHELTYDRFHDKADRIVRAQIDLELNGNIYKEASIPFPAKEALVRELPQIENAFRVYRDGERTQIVLGEAHFTEKNFYFADPAIFSALNFEWVFGDAASAFSDPTSVVITATTARKYFGDAMPVGKTLLYENTHLLKVSGVVRSFPSTSHFQFDLLAPLEFQLGLWKAQSGTEGRENKWFWTGAWTYLLLQNIQDREIIENRFPEFVKAHFPDRIKSGVRLSTIPLTEIHLYSNRDNEIMPNGSMMYVIVFSMIALVILCLACINFINLNTAQSMNRMREIGIRKILGATRTTIVLHVYFEFTILVIIAVGASLILSEIALPVFNTFVGRALNMHELYNVMGFFVLFVGVLTLGLLSGFYPALLFSRFTAIHVVRPSTTFRQNAWLRKVLVISQFAISIGLIILLGIVHGQLTYMRDVNLGFDKEKVLVIQGAPGIDRKLQTFRDELLKHPSIAAVSGASNAPGDGMYVYRLVPEGSSRERPEMLPMLTTEVDFLYATNIRIKDGRWFSKTNSTDASTAFVINEKAAKQLGWSSSAVGKKIELFAPGTNDIGKSGQVIGVIEDYHFESLHQIVKPLVITLDSFLPLYLVKLRSNDPSEALEYISSVWKKFSPDRPIEYNFLDERLNNSYKQESKFSEIIWFFTGLAIFIASLGLLGLTSFAIEKRTKEIGIRKVLGASTPSLVGLLSHDFIILVIWANVIGWPLAYLTGDYWLQQFAYRGDMDWKLYPLSGFIALSMAWLTICFNTFRAASANPVDALKYE